MKKLLSATVFFIMMLNSCSSTGTSGPKFAGSANYTITHTQKKSEKFHNVGAVDITYQDYAFLVREKKAKLANRMASAKESKSELRKIPKGGLAIVYIERITISAANTENFEFILKENGKELLREKGYSSIANVPTHGSSMWRNLYTVFFPKPITDKMTLYVVDNLTGIRDDFTISKN